MLAKISALFFFLSFNSALNAETISCIKTEDSEAVFSMNTESLQGLIVTAGSTLTMKCRDDGHKTWRCFAQSERDGLHSFEVLVSKSPCFNEYYGRNFWSYPLTCDVFM